MGKIYLLSGPDKKTGFDEKIAVELKKDFDNKKSLVAIATNPDNYEKNDKYFNGTEESLGVINSFKTIDINIDDYYLLDSRVKKEEAQIIVKEADIIYLLGGDPFTQLEYLKKNNLDTLIQQSDSIIMGVSAGSMNLAKNSYYSKDEDITESIFYEGLGITNISIDPHFDINNTEQVFEAEKMSEQYEIIGLPNSSAIIIDGKTVKYIGDYYIFN